MFSCFHVSLMGCSITDKDCVMLSRPNFIDPGETDKLILVATSCNGSRAFLCELQLYEQGRLPRLLSIANHVDKVICMPLSSRLCFMLRNYRKNQNLQ